MNHIRKTNMNLTIVAFVTVIIFFTISCSKDELTESNSETNYGVPDNVKLDAPCPGNGTWITKTQTHAKTPSSAPKLYANAFDGKVTMHDWLLDINVQDWKQGACANINFGIATMYVCDYAPYYTGEVLRAYIDPHKYSIDSDGNKMYYGYTTSGIEIRYWDYLATNKTIYMNFKVENGWVQQTLTPSN